MPFDKMDKHLHNAHQALTFEILNRISTMTDQRNFDQIFHRFLRKTGGGATADGESIFMPGATPSGNLEVAQGSGGLRETGYGMKINVGLGFKRVSVANQPNADEPNFIPLYGAVEKTFTTANSDPTNPRMDHVYLKQAETPGNSQSVNIIDPTPPNNITAEAKDTNQAYDYDFAYEVGTPDAGAAGGAGAPTFPFGYLASDKICEILVLAGNGAIDIAQITSTRDIAVIDPDLLGPGVSSLNANQIVVSPTVEGQADAQAALEALETAVNAMESTGINIGAFEYLNTVSVQIAPGLGDVVKIDIDGTLLSQGTPVIFDLTTDLDTGSETSDTPYYCYVLDVASAITPKISATAPHDIGDAKPGYHPANPTWRCVGMFYNDASSNITEFINDRGRTRFMGEHSKGILHAMTSSAAWVAILLPEVPQTAPAVIGWTHIQGINGTLYVGPSGLSGAPADTRIALLAIINGSNNSTTDGASIEVPITTRAVPAIGSGGTGGTREFHTQGWVDPWSPNRGGG